MNLVHLPVYINLLWYYDVCIIFVTKLYTLKKLWLTYMKQLVHNDTYNINMYNSYIKHVTNLRRSSGTSLLWA